VTIEELKLQRRWVCWRSVWKPGKIKPDKVPFQVNRQMARTNDPATWATFSECASEVAQFSGIGLVLGDGVFGVDIDKCCDAVTGKFTAESREAVIALDSYGEYSPNGEGCHVLGLGAPPGDKPIIRPYPGCKQVEIKGRGYYFTFTGRHLSKTPHELMDRQAELTALCSRVSDRVNVGVQGPQDEEARFQKLWAGDMSDYGEDHNRADLALCYILARRNNNDLFKIDEAFCHSGLFRAKWADRSDYRSRTILKAIKGEPVLVFDSEEPIDDDSPTEYLIEPQPGEDEGWFPKGEVSLVGGSSGAGKTYFVVVVVEKIRRGEDVFGHVAKPRDYRVLLHDRSTKAMRRTIRALRLPAEATERLIRLTPAQQKLPPAEILDACIELHPGVEIWFVEGLDLWIPNMNDMESVSQVMDSLQRVAGRRDVCVLGSVGSPKQKGKDRYFGRDAFFGSSALARKTETMVLIDWTDPEDTNSARSYSIMPRNGSAERLYMEWREHELHIVSKPEPPAADGKESTAFYRMRLNVFAKFKPGEMVVYSSELGAEKTFKRWRTHAADEGELTHADGHYFRPPETDP
jgi:hypothetical protein